MAVIYLAMPTAASASPCPGSAKLSQSPPLPLSEAADFHRSDPEIIPMPVTLNIFVTMVDHYLPVQYLAALVLLLVRLVLPVASMTGPGASLPKNLPNEFRYL